MIPLRVDLRLVLTGALISILAIFSLVGCDLITTQIQPSATPLPSLAPSGTPSPTPSPPTPSTAHSHTSPPPTRTHTATHQPPTATVTATSQIVRFAVIGDYGGGGAPEADVAALVKSFNPEFILTLGDNNYPLGSEETIDRNIGQFFRQFIFPYQGVYGEGAAENHFFPTLGNHDWDTFSAQPYLDYFTLPGNERYYDFVMGPVHFFALDSDSREPDGVGSSSTQTEWLQSILTVSTTPWQVVFFHHAPYSSGHWGSVDWMQWPFAEWGADAVLSGHDHTYERLFQDGIVYFVNGLGGGAIYQFKTEIEGSQVRYNGDYGAMLVEASDRFLRFRFINRQQEVIDDYEITQP